MTCSTCRHWSPRDTGEVQRAMAKVRMAICALGPRWVFSAATHTCEKHSPALPEITQARAIWLKR